MIAIWLKTKEAAEFEQVDERTIRRNIKKLISRNINSIGGNHGVKYEIALESLSPAAQARYHGEQTEKDQTAIAYLTDTQRAELYHKQTIVQSYWDFKATYPKADKLMAFLHAYNEQHPTEPITKRQLNYWENQYKRNGSIGLADKRGGSNKGQSSIPENVMKVFLAYWLQEKGTNTGGPSVASCYRLTKMNFPDIPLPSISSFKRMINTIPLPTKILGREGKKAFDDKCMPYLSFDYNSIHTNEQWVADNHVFDVLVRFEDGHVGRPWIIGWLDRRSRYIVGYLMLDTDPNADAILDAFARAVHSCGIPEGVLLDNGKDYTVHDLFNRENTYSLANEMNISVTNAIKYNAKAKPIERFFNTLEYSYCIHLPSYIGANPQRRPEKMQKVNDKLKNEAMPYSDFSSYINNTINTYNNTPHSGEGMDGRTPSQAFKECITVPIRQANEVLLSMYFKRTSRLLKVSRNGVRVPELGLRYDSDDLFQYQGRQIQIRYNTDDLRKVFCIDEEGGISTLLFSGMTENPVKLNIGSNLR